MTRIVRARTVGLIPEWVVLGAWLVAPAAGSAVNRIDPDRSTVQVRVYRSGLFSFLAHDHLIVAPIARGELQMGENPAVELWMESAKLRVLDPDLAPATRSEVQEVMEGTRVLDVARFPQIYFRSTRVESKGGGLWTIHGVLDFRGQARPLTIEVKEENGRYKGSAKINQRDFGITPVRLVGGAVRVKDEVTVEFEIVPAP